jgi:hypothetical protein
MDAGSGQPIVPPSVVRDLPRMVVLNPIHLNGETCVGAIKVENVRANGMLAPKP